MIDMLSGYSFWAGFLTGLNVFLIFGNWITSHANDRLDEALEALREANKRMAKAIQLKTEVIGLLEKHKKGN